jgi:hypothetical protein
MSGAGPLVGPPASNRLLSPGGLGLEEGEGLLDEELLGEVVLGEALLGEALLGEALLCVVVVVVVSLAL